MNNSVVMSLRSGRPIANLLGPIINPNNLFIEAWYVSDNISGQKLVLLSRDIREVMGRGFIVDDHDVLSEESDLIRLKDIIKLDFQLLGLKVVSESKKHYGKVVDYAFETESFIIKKIYSGQPLIRSISGGNLSIDRTQIIEITNRRIVIEDPTIKSDEKSLATAPVS